MVWLSSQQKALIIGSILGDGCLIANRTKTSARLQIRHQLKHKAYVEWKYRFLKDIVHTKPRLDSYNNSWYFRTKQLSVFGEYRSVFYKNNQRFIPHNIDKYLLHPLSLAVWFMDDGNGYQHYRGLRISTYAFKREGTVLLQKALLNTFCVKTNVIQDIKGYQLLIPARSAVRFKTLIEPFTLTSMNYKLATLTP